MTASASQNNLGTVLPNAGGSFAIAESEIQANVIGSTTINPIVLQHLSVPLTAAQLIAMFGTPVQIIPAGATGSAIVVHDVLFNFTAGGTQFTGGGVSALQYGTTDHSGGTLITPTIAASVVTSASSSSTTVGCTNAAAAITVPTATGVYISNATAPFAAGNGTAFVDVWYSVVPSGV
jgi:hypothetical protein